MLSLQNEHKIPIQFQLKYLRTEVQVLMTALSSK